MKRHHSPQPTARTRSRSAQPIRGTSWSITDETLRSIDEQIAVHDPERGGAMITVAGSRYVVDFVADPRPGEAVSYFHSDQLRRALADYYTAHPKRHYAGTLHSHPGGYAEPSGPDHEQYLTTLTDNPSMREGLFPIVVATDRSALSTGRLGDAHLIDLPHGVFAGYSAHPQTEEVEVRPAPMHVVPLQADMTEVARSLEARGMSVSMSGTRELDLEGRNLPIVTVAIEDRGSVSVLFPETYPTCAPILISPRHALTSPEWVPSKPSGEQLATAVRRLLEAGPDPAREMAARLTHHLPDGAGGRILVVGAGSVGSTACEMLVRSGVRELTVLDFDTVSPPNLSRSVYERLDIGRLKVDALRDRLRRIEPELDFTGVAHDIHDIDLTVLDDVAAVVLATDDLTAEMWLGHHLYERRIPAVSIKMFALGDAGEIVVVDPRGDTPCLHCLVGDLTHHRGEADYGTGRLVAAPALGPDVIATVARGVKIILGLTQSVGPLADLVRPLVTESRTYFQQANVAQWRDMVAFRRGAESRPFDSMWVIGEGNPGCSVCGRDREPAPAASRLVMSERPPGVLA